MKQRKESVFSKMVRFGGYLNGLPEIGHEARLRAFCGGWMRTMCEAGLLDVDDQKGEALKLFLEISNDTFFLSMSRHPALLAATVHVLHSNGDRVISGFYFMKRLVDMLIAQTYEDLKYSCPSSEAKKLLKDRACFKVILEDLAVRMSEKDSSISYSTALAVLREHMSSYYEKSSYLGALERFGAYFIAIAGGHSYDRVYRFHHAALREYFVTCFVERKRSTPSDRKIVVTRTDVFVI